MNKGQSERESSIVNKFNEYKEFIKDRQVEFIVKKMERIAYGVYLLSNFIPEDESLHADIKKTSHTLLKTVSEFVLSTGIKPVQFDRVHGQLQYLSSLLSLGFISGFVSGSNVDILKNEINYLHKHIEELSTKSATESANMHFKSDLFVVGQVKVSRPKSDPVSFIRQSTPRPQVKRPDTPTPVSFIKDTPKTRVPAVSSSDQESKEDREIRILDVIRDKRVVSIKDISSVIFDCSEKTIQRTLQALIDKGQIRKEGERRWAKYQLM